MGGGVPARLCEAAALAALGAHGTAARLLTSLAANPNRAISAGLRAVILTDGARQWLDAGRPDLARAALAEADQITVPDADRQILAARAAAAEADWPAARSALEAALADEPRRRARPRAPRRRAPQRRRSRRRPGRGRARPRPRPRPARGAVRDRRRPGRDRRDRPRLAGLARSSSPLTPTSSLAALARANLQRPQLSRAAAQAPASRHHRVRVPRQPPRHRQRAPASPELPIA